MRDDLPHLYDSKKNQLFEKLADIPWCSITSDLWTSRCTMAFMTLTCHFITEMESAVLETWNVPESHTICNLATELKTVAEKWAIVNKIHCTITDAASNIKGAVNSNRWNHMVCFAHKLNLVVTCAIDEVNDVKDIIEDVKRNVAFFHRSTKASEKLPVKAQSS